MVVKCLRQKKQTIIGMLLASVSIAICILIDNYVDLPYSLKGETGSVYYYFFGSIVYGGLFGVYILPILCVFPWYQKVNQHKRDRANILFRMLKCGITFALGYVALIVLLRLINLPLFMEYEKQEIIEAVSHGEVFAYQEIIASDGEVIYFVIAVFYAFLEGCLCGTIAEIVSYHKSSSSCAILSPAVGMICLVYLSKYLGIPDEYRLDRWLLMRAVCVNSLLTIFITVIATIIIVTIVVFMLTKKDCWLKYNAGELIHKHSYHAIWLVVTFFVLSLALKSLLTPINTYTRSTSSSVTPFAFPFIISESFFQMIYMIIYISYVGLFVRCDFNDNSVNTKKHTISTKLIIISLLMSGCVLLLSCISLNNLALNNDWKPVWAVFALRYNDYLEFNIPLSFIQNNSPLVSLLMSFIFTNLCSVLLGTVYLLGNIIKPGFGSIISVGITLLDITAYNLLEFKIFKYSPLSWAQYIDYDKYGQLNQKHISVYCFVFLALICTNLLVLQLVKKRRLSNA